MKHKLKVVIAPASFGKGIDARSAAEAIARGLKLENGDVETVILPVADGTKGTVFEICPSENVYRARVIGPNYKKVFAYYGIIGDTAIIETEQAVGLSLMRKKTALNSTTFGVGQLINRAVRRGAKKIILTVGDCAANDGGCGMMSAICCLFADYRGHCFTPTGKNLDKIERIRMDAVKQKFYGVEYVVATDVKNKLLGFRGATRAFAKQKGATRNEIKFLEKSMRRYAKLLHKACGKKVSHLRSTGAGGGIAAPLIAWFDARVCTGVEAVFEIMGLNDAIKDADVVITGADKINQQALGSKAMTAVVRAAKKNNKPVYCFAQAKEGNDKAFKKYGIKGVFTLDDALCTDELLCGLARKNAGKIIDN